MANGAERQRLGGTRSLIPAGAVGLGMTSHTSGQPSLTKMTRTTKSLQSTTIVGRPTATSFHCFIL
jgi:hypothetical protein